MNKYLGGTFMNFKESILNRLDYDEIARKVFSILKEEIRDEVVNNISENDIADAIADSYSCQLIEIAKDRVLEEIVDSISYEDIEGEFKDVVDEEMC